MKEKNLQTSILSEYYSAVLYLDRISFYILKIDRNKKELHLLLKDFYTQISSFFNSQFLICPLQDLNHENSKNLYLEIKKVFNLTIQLFNLSLTEDFQKQIFIPFINLVYKNAHQLHLFCRDNNLSQIDLPTVNILKSKEVAALPLFYLDPEDFLNLNGCPILSMEAQRLNKYEDFLNKALEAISFKQHYRAIEFLSKALNYKETAEILSLLGWLYLITNKVNLAKEFCQKAIKLDPELGPPYNDLGLIFMEEGNLKESLRLFNLAKKAPKYQNREYPYINSGRVYMFLKKYDLALYELQMALTLVPFHQNLHQTVQNLMKKIPSEKLWPSKEIN